VPVDASIAIIPPHSDVSKELATFSGKWAGPFNGVNTGAWMSDAFLVVEEISSPTSIKVYYAQIGRFRTNYDNKWSVRANAKFADGTLEFTTPDALVIACSVNSSDSLSCTITNAQGGRNRGTFRRVKN
jgi:hypothetical protein